MDGKEVPFGVKIIAIYFFLLSLHNIYSIIHSQSFADSTGLSLIFFVPLFILTLIIGILLFSANNKGRILGAAYSGLSLAFMAFIYYLSDSSKGPMDDYANFLSLPNFLFDYSLIIFVLKLIVYVSILGYLLFNKSAKEAFENKV